LAFARRLRCIAGLIGALDRSLLSCFGDLRSIGWRRFRSPLAPAFPTFVSFPALTAFAALTTRPGCPFRRRLGLVQAGRSDCRRQHGRLAADATVVAFSAFRPIRARTSSLAIAPGSGFTWRAICTRFAPLLTAWFAALSRIASLA
jgi:hypothetical protein